MGFFDGIPQRSNGDDILASWFNTIKSFLNLFSDQNSVPSNISLLGKTSAGWTFGATGAGEVNVAASTSETGDFALAAGVESGFTFKGDKSGELAKVTSRLVDRGLAAKDGTVVAQLYLASSGLPTGSVLDTSDSFDTSTLVLNAITSNDFVFTGNVSIIAGAQYAIVFLSTDTGTVNIRSGIDQDFSAQVLENGAPPPDWVVNSNQATMFHQIFFDNLVDSGNLILGSDIFASVPPLLVDRHKIVAQTINLENNQVAFIEIDRAAAGPTTAPVIVKSITEASPDGEKLVIALAFNDKCYTGIGSLEEIVTGETVEIGNAASDIADLKVTKENKSEKNAANGYAGLTGSSQILATALPLLAVKGDLLSRDASANVKLGVGTNTQILTADSAEASGLKWGDPPVSGATIELDNLGVTNINAALLFDTDNVYNIGSAAKTAATVFAKNFILGSDVTAVQNGFKVGEGVGIPQTFGLHADKFGQTTSLGIATAGQTGVDSGDIVVKSGDASTASLTGKFSVTTGALSGGTGDTGGIELTVGASFGGSPGEFKFLKTDIPSVVSQVWTATGVNGEGYWSDALGTVILAATSAVKTYPSGVNYLYLLMTGNSVALTPGTWELVGSVRADNSGTAPEYNFCNLLWASANGADTTSAPATLNLDAGEGNSLNIFGASTDIVSRNEIGLDRSPAIYTTAVNQTIFLVPRFGGNAISNSTSQTTMYARKIKEI